LQLIGLKLALGYGEEELVLMGWALNQMPAVLITLLALDIFDYLRIVL
jgi:hypothetical protein